MRRAREWLAGLVPQRQRVFREHDRTACRLLEPVQAALIAVEPLLFDEHQAVSRRADGAELASQVEGMWDAYEAAGTADPDLARRLLAARLSAMRQVYSASDLAGAIDIGSRTLAYCVRVLGADHTETLL